MNKNLEKSLSEQIYDELLSLIHDCPDFSENCKNKIRKIIEDEELNKTQKVLDVILTN